jgi:diguanylate cyclase (GGDEF)-like protein
MAVRGNHTIKKVTSFLSAVFSQGVAGTLDDGLKSHIASSLVSYIGKDPVQGQRAITELLDKITALQEENRALKDENTKMAEVSLTDPLTGAYNTRFFDRVMDELSGNPYANQRKNFGKHHLMLIDLDGFKQINDRLSHGVGDAILKNVVNELVSMTRKSDAVCRIGGDEFVVILRNSTSEGARKKVMQITEAFDFMTYNHNGVNIPIRASIGWSEIDPAKFKDEIMKKIDYDMYAIKHAKGDTRHGTFDVSMFDDAPTNIPLIKPAP